MGTESMDVCWQDSCTLEMDASSDLLKSGCHLLISSQTGTQHHQQPCRKGLLMQKGWAGIQLWLKKPLLAILDKQKNGPCVAVSVCLKKLHYQALKEMEAETIGAAQEAGYSLCWEVYLLSYWLYSQFKDWNILSANVWPLVLCANELQMELQLSSPLEQLVLDLNSSEANAFFCELRQSHGSCLGLEDVACVMAAVAHDCFWSNNHMVWKMLKSLQWRWFFKLHLILQDNPGSNSVGTCGWIATWGQGISYFLQQQQGSFAFLPCSEVGMVSPSL